MRLTLLSLCSLLCMFGVLASCRSEPAPVARPVTSWMPSDSETVAAALMGSLVRSSWASEWKAANQGRVPAVSFGEIEDASGDNVPVASLIQACADQIAKADATRVVLSATGAGTVRVTGRISKTSTVVNGALTHRFQIDLRLFDVEKKEALGWQGPMEHAVVDTRP